MIEQSYTDWVKRNKPAGYYAESQVIGGEISELGPYRNLKDAVDAALESFPSGMTFRIIEKSRDNTPKQLYSMSFERRR